MKYGKLSYSILFIGCINCTENKGFIESDEINRTRQIALEEEGVEEQVHPPSQIAGTYLYCHTVREAIETKVERKIGCIIFDDSTDLPADEGKSAVWSYRQQKASSLTADIIPNPDDYWHVFYRIKADSLSQLQKEAEHFVIAARFEKDGSSHMIGATSDRIVKDPIVQNLVNFSDLRICPVGHTFIDGRLLLSDFFRHYILARDLPFGEEPLWIWTWMGFQDQSPVANYNSITRESVQLFMDNTVEIRTEAIYDQGEGQTYPPATLSYLNRMAYQFCGQEQAVNAWQERYDDNRL